MSVFKTAAAAIALTVAAQTTSASTSHYLDYQGTAGRSGGVTVEGDGVDLINGIAAAFRMHDASNALGLGYDFIAFCLDLAGYVGDDYYKINNTAPFDPERKLSDFQKVNVENLFQASYKLVDVSDNVQAAAFQMALWEAAYETDETVNLSLMSGTRTGSSTNALIKTTAEGYLANLATWDGTINFRVNFLDADQLARQDLVTAAPVPVPAAGLLLLGGLGAFAALRRRGRKQG